MRLEENKPLAPFTTFGIGGPARWFVEAASDDEVAEAAAWSAKNRIKLFVLGGGSNLLAADQGFDGLVLKIGLRGVAASDVGAGSQGRLYQVAAGEEWDPFVTRTVRENCAGIECLAGIPGTVGGTPVQNVGAYGQEVASVIEVVRAFDLVEHKFKDFNADECRFAYRRSRFNSVDVGRFAVTRVTFRLTVGGAPTLRYGELLKAFEGNSNPTLSEVAAVVRRIRQSKGMLLVEGDSNSRSAGSFFKNPLVSKGQRQHIIEVSGKEPPYFPSGTDKDDAVKLPAAWLIEQAGYGKGHRRGAAAVSSCHTLALVNLGGASASDILALALEITEAVRLRFGVLLEREPVLLGF